MPRLLLLFGYLFYGFTIVLLHIQPGIRYGRAFYQLRILRFQRHSYRGRPLPKSSPLGTCLLCEDVAGGNPDAIMAMGHYNPDT
jgi:hypothetical protein